MSDEHIIIIGAGAAGLIAAKELSTAGKKITILEARDYLGGRIHTIYDPHFATHAELGAEFVHGDLPATLGLLNEGAIPYHKTGGEMWQAKDGMLKQEYHQIPHWDVFEEKLKVIETDTTINEFLDQYFSGDKYEDLRVAVRRYAAGFDTADPATASAMALRDEWLDEDDEDQYRPDKGYQPMIDFMADKCRQHGCTIHTGAIVKQIQWSKNTVQVTTNNGTSYTGNRVVITVPVGVLQASDNEEGAITYIPALPEIKDAINNMAIGAIIKVLLQFSEAFWESEAMTKLAGKSMDKMSFIFSQQEAIPTFWTQYPGKSALLTGWLGGPNAMALKDATDEHILRLALESLAHIFSTTPLAITKLLTISKVINWTADPYSRGSYSYAKTGTNAARKILSQPVQDTIYFAGEALYDGPVMGTVEAALVSGKSVAQKILELAI